MSHVAPQVEFVEDPVQIESQTTLHQAERNIGMSMRIGRKLDQLVFHVRERLAQAPIGEPS